jgi:hypothetical protein
MRANTDADFWAKGLKDEQTGCLIWQGSKNKAGYGYYSLHTKTIYAHRHAMQIKNGGPIPKGQVVMHSCDNPSCFNPSHLSIGTYTDNAQDRQQKGRGRTGYARLTHCKRGHEFTPENTEVHGRNRKCRQCAYDTRRARTGVETEPIQPGSMRRTKP